MQLGGAGLERLGGLFDHHFKIIPHQFLLFRPDRICELLQTSDFNPVLVVDEQR
jgi:hypothetical protein